MREFLESLPLAQIRMAALAIVYTGITYLVLKLILRYLKRFAPIGRYNRLSNLTIWLYTVFVLMWGLKVPAHNFFYNLILSLALVFTGFLFVISVEYVIFDILLKRDESREPAPGLLRDVLRMAVLLLVVFAVISGVFKFDLSTVLVSSAVMTAVIGLALQDLLGNVLAGVALSVEKPFNVGDWVQVAGQDGEVVSISWRATRIKNIGNNYVVVPNGSISRAEIVNYSQPEPRMLQLLEFGTSYSDPPNKVRKVVREVASQVPGIMKYPEPITRTVKYSDFSIDYVCRYYIDNFSSQWDIADDLSTRLWYRFRREGIEIPFPIRTIQSMERSRKLKAQKSDGDKKDVVRYIRSLELFSMLSDDIIQELSEDSLLYEYGEKEDVIVQGDPGDSMFLIVSGRVKIVVKDERGYETDVAELGPGEAFGEMSLFTGENRAATVRCLEDSSLIEITKENFKNILLKDTSLVEKIASKIEVRTREIKDKLEKAKTIKPRDGKEQPRDDSLFRMIKNFFEL
ncbi:MAG: mechanosensitive ion channel [candidate division Zixibacteria bacterium]|nr:mechanosensitive ion channel [candidate division Zixibacteria bacterium]